MKKVIMSIILAFCVLAIASCNILPGDSAETTACNHEDSKKIVTIEGIAPTCQSTGLSEGKQCSVCGEIVVPQTTIEKIACREGEPIIDKEATNAENGEGHLDCVMCGKLMREIVILAGNMKLEYALLEDGTYAVTDLGTCKDEDIVIPSEFNGKPVTAIGMAAFAYSSVRSVSIPETVTSIGFWAFFNCSSLETVNIPSSVTFVDESAFRSCGELIFNEYDNALYLGNESNPYLVLVKAKDTSITSCEIHKDTKFIQTYAFEKCSLLENIEIPEGVTDIRTGAFQGCSSLESVSIPETVTNIGTDIFSECSSLVSVEIPSSIKVVGGGMFFQCTSLKSLTLGSSIETIELMALYECTSLETINFGGTLEQWYAIEKGENWNKDTGDYTVVCSDGTASE